MGATSTFNIVNLPGFLRRILRFDVGEGRGGAGYLIILRRRGIL